jgi:preprotein translocase subunit SecD
MKNRWQRFNIYLLVMLAAAVVCGCQSTGEKQSKKQLSTLRLHLEASSNGARGNEAVPVYRAHPVMVNVEKVPFLTEGDVAGATVVDSEGSFVLRVRFKHAGAALLEQCTAGNRGRKIAVFCQFGEGLQEYRWLGAPIITHRISDGVFIFTPDATREETEEIALGLNNVAKKVETWIDK